jgi:hypothetical protein
MNESEYEDFSIYNFSSIMNFIKNNYIQIFMLFLVFIIIYIVDHISNINAMIFSMPSPIPGMASQNPQTKLLQRITVPKKRKNSKKI